MSRCECGSASVPGLQGQAPESGLHAQWCPMSCHDLAGDFAALYGGCTFSAVWALAPRLIKGDPERINVADFWHVFGGLDPDFNQREADHGGIARDRLGSAEYWRVIP